jgi:hypothetical protein
MLIPGFPVAEIRGGAAAGAAGLAAVPFATGGAAVLAPDAGALGFRPESGEIFAARGGPPRGAPGAVEGEEEAPIFRAWAEAASFVDFSLMARCFSSSLARMGTRSSGMGLLSWVVDQYGCRPKKQSGTYLETLTELDEVCHPFVHVALDQRLPFLL